MSIANSDAQLIVGGAAIPVRILRPARSRGYRLSMAATGELRLSLPPRGNLKKALAWAQEQEEWLARRIAAQPALIPLCDGASVPIDGTPTQIVWQAGAKRGVTLAEGRLLVGGPADSVAPRVLRWLKARAKTVLEAETRDLAARHGLRVTSVSVADPRSRWGSCSSSGAIRYSWRLILCPPAVRRSTVAHELAHLLHMDHSPAFHAAHARLFGGDPAFSRAWLRQHGGDVHRYTA